MNIPDEHSDDLEPEVNDETEKYPDDEDLADSEQGRDLINPSRRVDEGMPGEQDEDEGESSDTI
jgi:hypothetical protein